MRLLIIGASGSIGNNLYDIAIKKSIDVIGTKYKSEDKKYIKFDFMEQEIEIIDQFFSPSNGEKIAVICAADSNIENCGCNYENSFKKNVIYTKKMIDNLNHLGYYTIFLSTDNVFDGKNGNYSEDAYRSPINKYGEMKMAVEDYIVSRYPDNCILRLGKVVGDFSQKDELFREWYDKANNNEIIYCIKDNYLSPVYIKDVVECIFLAMELKLSGIYNIAGQEVYRRFDLCGKFMKYFDIEGKIEEKNLSDFNFREQRPLNTVMKNTKFVNRTNYKFQSMQTVINNFIQFYNIEESDN